MKDLGNILITLASEKHKAQKVIYFNRKLKYISYENANQVGTIFKLTISGSRKCFYTFNI